MKLYSFQNIPTIFLISPLLVKSKWILLPLFFVQETMSLDVYIFGLLTELHFLPPGPMVFPLCHIEETSLNLSQALGKVARALPSWDAVCGTPMF